MTDAERLAAIEYMQWCIIHVGRNNFQQALDALKRLPELERENSELTAKLYSAAIENSADGKTCGDCQRAYARWQELERCKRGWEAIQKANDWSIYRGFKTDRWYAEIKVDGQSECFNCDTALDAVLAAEEKLDQP